MLKQIQKFWQDKEITLLDRTQENSSAIKTISDFFEQNYPLKITSSQKSSHYNLVLIHDLDYYAKEDKTDAYYSSQTEVVQNMTVEGVMHKSGTVVKSALVNAVKELTIKAILESEDFSPLNTEINLDDFIFYKYYPESNQTLEFTSHETNFKIQETVKSFV